MQKLNKINFENGNFFIWNKIENETFSISLLHFLRHFDYNKLFNVNPQTENASSEERSFHFKLDLFYDTMMKEKIRSKEFNSFLSFIFFLCSTAFFRRSITTHHVGVWAS